MKRTNISPKNKKRKVNKKGDKVSEDVENATELNTEQERNVEDVENGAELNIEQEEIADDAENANELNTNQDENSEGHEETVHEQAAPDKEQDPVQPSSKRRRGPTRMKHIARDPNVREPVDFTDCGEPCGTGSVKLSSYLGPLVREHVPIIVDDWRKVSENIKTVLWKSIQARFELDEEYQKMAVFRQMGCLWRSSKSRVVTKIRKAKTMKERMQLKPKNIPPVEWRKFVNEKTSSAFKAVSDSYKERRQKQIPHTVSRKGMVRLSEEMKKSCSDPSQLTRLKVWVKSRTKKDGTPVNNQAAEKIRTAKDVETGTPSSSTTNFGKNDALAQVLGPDNPGRLRAMGRGMSKTKLACYQLKSAYMNQMQENQAQLQEKVQELEAIVLKMNNQREDEQGETSAPRSVNKSGPPKCLLVDWTGTKETVGEGRLLSDDPEEYVNEIPLGPSSVKVLVESAIVPSAFLWRPTTNMTTLEEAVGHIIAWNSDSCVVAVTEVIEDDSVPKSPFLSSRNKCTLLDWVIDDDKPVAQGSCQSRDPQAMVNGIPIGPNAVKIFVDVVLSPHAFPWRPTSDMTKMEQTLHSYVAWPANKVENETQTEASASVQKYPQGQKSPAQSTSKSKSTTCPSLSLNKSPETPKTSASGPIATSHTSKSTPQAPAKKPKQPTQSPIRKSVRNVIKDNKKCKLMDISGSNRVVAEGRWASNDPRITVHFVPLGPNAVRVWVDVVKIKSAAVWRRSSEIETMEDALGTSIAWPEDKVVMCSED